MEYDSIKINQKRYFDLCDAETLYINGKTLDECLYDITNNNQYLNLMPAWSNALWGDDSYDIEEKFYLFDLLMNQIESNVPILLCPDDFDFSCTIVVVKIKYLEDSVLWENLGIVKKDNFSLDEWKQSGYQNLKTWSIEDWDTYGDDYAVLGINDPKWHILWSKEWKEENKRRIYNYWHQYFNDDENIEWINNCQYIFEKDDYVSTVKRLMTNK